jgi:hypothetical protein
VGAIGLPGFIVTIVSFSQTDSSNWRPVATAISQGVFIIPVMILAADTFWRWCLRAGRRWITVVQRLIALPLSGIATLTCLLAATQVGAGAAPGTATGRALTAITIWCLISVLPVSLLGVVVSNAEAAASARAARRAPGRPATMARPGD